MDEIQRALHDMHYPTMIYESIAHIHILTRRNPIRHKSGLRQNEQMPKRINEYISHAKEMKPEGFFRRQQDFERR